MSAVTTACRPGGENTPRGAQSNGEPVARPGIPADPMLGAQGNESAWLHYSRNYAGWRYAPLDQINRDNLDRLAPKWVLYTGVAKGAFETTPIVFDGRMYLTTSDSHLLCVDVRDGALLWRYDHTIDEYVQLCCGPVNRGPAVWQDRVYFASLDAKLHCFDAVSGEKQWGREVADYRDNYSITMAPLVIKDMVLVGVSGGVFGARCFLDAYDARSGDRIWRFYTVPGPGEFGHDTWTGDSWEHGGAPVWLTGTYDPELDLTYWGVGNPSPVHDGSIRKGDNLFSGSIVALEAETGRLAWHFQTTPHDIFDWDAVSECVLMDTRINGRDVKALVQVNRNGFVYALDRTNGKLLYARPYSEVNWANVDATGKPGLKPALQQPGDRLIEPGVFGGKNWPPSAFNPALGLIFTPDMYYPSVYTVAAAEYNPGKPYRGGDAVFPEAQDHRGYIKAIDVRNGALRWRFETPGGPNWAGLLATGSGLVFGGARDGALRAFDAGTGEVLWSYPLGEPIIAPPITFEFESRQYLGIAVGWRRPSETGSRYVLFELRDR